VRGHLLGDLQSSAVLQISRYAGGRKVWQPISVLMSAAAATPALWLLWVGFLKTDSMTDVALHLNPEFALYIYQRCSGI
jgi:hypothetical protein